MENTIRYEYIGEDKHMSGQNLMKIYESNSTNEESLMWKKTLCEYLVLNLELSMRYQGTEMKEVEISYDPLRDIQIQVMTSKDDRVDGRASSIPYKAWCDNEDDRDSFKECECQDDIIWSEFCEYCPHENIRPIMEKVCEELENTLGVPVRLRD